jgi:hypothetical protein
MKNLSFNGYTCFCHSHGIYSFKKKDNGGYWEIECTEEQLSNGDIEFMTENGITLSAERKRNEVRKYLRRQLQTN